MRKKDQNLFYLPQYRESLVDRITNAYFKRGGPKEKENFSYYANKPNQSLYEQDSKISQSKPTFQSTHGGRRPTDPFRSGERLHKQAMRDHIRK